MTFPYPQKPSRSYELEREARIKKQRLEIATKILIACLNNPGENLFTDIADRAVKTADRLIRLNNELEP